ncbi:hypothetical protein Pan2_99 [Pseudanabaena phage Pan2]|nr:hypothetical protein Pan2_99 [Pseudanabaena phage Pan2]
MTSLLAELRGDPLKWSVPLAAGHGCYSKGGTPKMRFVSEAQVRQYIRERKKAHDPSAC